MNRCLEFLIRVRKDRWVLYAYSFTAVSLTAACVYGWPALRRTLRREDDVAVWSSESALGAAFTAGSWSTQGLRFFAGVARDRYGTVVVVAFCLTAVVTGSVGIAVAGSPLAMGTALFVQGIGSGAQLCLQPVVAKSFPNHAGAVLASLSGGAQVSGLVYLSLTKAFDSRKTGFLTHAVIVSLFAMFAPVMLHRKSETPTTTILNSTEGRQDDFNGDEQPSSSAEAAHEDTLQRLPSRGLNDETAGNAVVESEDTDRIESNQGENPGHTPDNDEGDRYDPKETRNIAIKSVWTHVRSWRYILLVQWFSLVITPLQYYVGSIGFQLEDKGDESGKYSDLFTILYGSLAVLSPVGGFLADQYSLGLAQGVSTLLVTLSFFMLISSASLQVQSIGLACNAIGRMWIFGTFSTHVVRVFGYQHFGTLAGLGLLTSAAVSVLQYPLIAAAANGKADAMNWLSGCILASELVYCYWLRRNGF